MHSPSGFAGIPAFKVAVLVLCGVIAGRWLPVHPLAKAVLAVPLCLVLAAIPVMKRCHVPEAWLFWTVCFLCFLAGATKLSFDRTASGSGLPEEGSRNGTLVGLISDEPERREKRIRLLIDGRQWTREGRTLPCRTRVIVTFLQSRVDSAPVTFAYGMTVALAGVMERPSEERNPGEMSLRQYYEANGITHVMTVRGIASVRILDSAGGTGIIRNIVLPSRRWILALLDSTTGGEEGEFLKGLLIGERGGLTKATKEAFINAGVAHILAVSGSNVAVVASMLFLVLQFLRFPRQIRVLAVIAGLIWYMLLTGSQPPVVRATITASIMLIAGLVQKRGNPFNSLGVAALVILGIDARQAFDVGFQLSFGAVLSIMYLYPIINAWILHVRAGTWWTKASRFLLQVCAVSLSATLGTLPITALAFERVSIVGIAANVVVIPATGLSVMIGAATIVGGLLDPWIAHIYGTVNRLILHWTLVLTRLAGFSSVAYIDTFGFTILDAVPYLALLLSVIQRSGRPWPRRLIIILLAANVALMYPRPSPARSHAGILRISFIDVGQGDAILVELPDNHAVLIDAGPRTPEDDAGSRVVVPFLKRRGIASLDLLLASHLHSDHIGGLPAVLSQCNVKRLMAMSPTALRTGLGPLWPQSVDVACDSARAGEVILHSPSVRLYTVYPCAGRAAGGGNASLAVKLQYGSVSFLLPGDAEHEEEGAMVRAYGDFLHSTVIKAGHHGSSTSSSDNFLRAVHPEAAVISVGRYNTFRHPSPSVLARYEEAGATVMRTDEEGAVIFETDGRTLTKVDWR